MSMQEQEAKLKRSLGLFDVVCLGVNAVIGQGIFLLPGLAFALLGPASLLALLCAALLAFLIALCFAEVGSRFKSTGGAYAYAREAFGPLAGFEVGWMLCVVCVVSWAALANGFTIVLGVFIPAVTEGVLQKVVAVGLMTVMMAINLFGSKIGGKLSTVFSVAKLVPLLVFVVAGLIYFDPTTFHPFAPDGYEKLPEGILLLLYALVGFESSVVPAGEMEEPQKAVPISLVSVMVLVCIVYVGVFVACISLHPSLSGAKRPVSEAAEALMGSAGGQFIAIGILISVLGINAAQALVGPRKIFAMAERGDLPSWFAEVHEGSGVPRRAILATYLVSVALTIHGSFKDLAILGVVARFAQYIPTCLALLVFRKRDVRSTATKGFLVPGGQAIACLTVLLIIWLIYETPVDDLKRGLIALAVGIPFYLLSRWNARPEDV
jgi:amino acid transporter